jgi:hypothetical protein
LQKKRQLFISATNPATGVGYANLPFKIQENKTIGGEPKFKTLYEGNLDENGKAFLPLKFHKNRGYYISCKPSENTCYNKPTIWFWRSRFTRFRIQF